ncbi:MAG: hypothetical protein EOM67_06215 [Spirochaetia bacterium]|nr:hypothetical protein [Spirochaetia bacterium]
MKKLLMMFLLVTLLGTLFVGCSTTEFTRVHPFTASVSFPSEGQYKILGRVDFVSSQGNAGFAAFLNYAKTIYPTTDDIVNIIVDTENTYSQSSGFPMMPTTATLVSSVYTMSGIAIEYIEQ